MVSQVVELFDEGVFRAFPFIQVVDLALPWEYFLHFAELSILRYSLGVYVDHSGHFEPHSEHLPTLCDSPDSHDAWLESLLDLHYVPVRFQDNVIHVPDEGGEALMLVFLSIFDYSLLIFEHLSNASPAGFLVL